MKNGITPQRRSTISLLAIVLLERLNIAHGFTPLHRRRGHARSLKMIDDLVDLVPQGSGSMTRSNFLATLVTIPLAVHASSSAASSESVSPPAEPVDAAPVSLDTDSIPSDAIATIPDAITTDAFDSSALASSSITEAAASARSIEESVSGVVAGSILSVTKCLVKYPLDTVTVKFQMPGSTYSLKDVPRLLDGSLRGVEGPLLANIPGGALFFAVKDASLLAMDGWDCPRWFKTAIAVAAAQPPYWLIRNPSEVVKTRQQAGLEGYDDDVSILEAYRKVRDDAKAKDSNSSGLGEFYLGFWENNLSAYPADVIKFVIYDQLTGGRKNLPATEGALAGSVSTAIAQWATTPLDVIRNRTMARKKGSKDDDTTELSYVASLRKIAKEDGVAGLFAGAYPRVARSFLSGATQFATYEATKRELAMLFGRKP